MLGIGIFIVFMFLLHNGIRAFYDKPMYGEFASCTRAGYTDTGYGRYYPYPEKAAPYGTNCSVVSGLREQEQTCAVSGGEVLYSYDDLGCVSGISECNYCTKEYTEAMKEYNKQVFVISLVVGILVLLTGWLVLSVEPVGSALMASGIGAIVYGTIINWDNLGNVGRFLLLLFAFVLLILIAYRLNRVQKKDWQFWKR